MLCQPLNFLLLLVVSFVVTAKIVINADPLVVTLADGTQLQGKLDKSIATFKAVPFAQPPVGALRFSPPVPWVNPNISEVLDATKHGHFCPQYLWGDDGLFDDSNEDCLTLNIFVNADVINRQMGENDLLPVGIFVHGGSYLTGGSSLPLYDGVDMIEYMEGLAILVTTNYRLNAFGFLGSDKLRVLDPTSGSTGNAGIQDQRLAFKWVQDNIISFGGDKAQVTIFGESAGAGSMSNHLVMKNSWGLFNQVILESGSFADWSAGDMTCAELIYSKLLEAANCDTVDCLQALSTKVLMGRSMSIYPAVTAAGCRYGPLVDGVELSTHPWIALTEGDVADVNILHGTNTDEGALPVFTVFPHDGSQDDLYAYWAGRGYSEDEISTLETLYVDGKTYPDLRFGSVYWWAAQRAEGDNFMSCPAEHTSQQLAAHASKRESSTYFYHFEHLPRGSPVTRHVSEMQYVFHQSELIRAIDGDLQMADVMASYWFHFISSGSPNGHVLNRATHSLPLWEAYSSAGDNILRILDGDNAFMLSHLKWEECMFATNRTNSSLYSLYAT